MVAKNEKQVVELTWITVNASLEIWPVGRTRLYEIISDGLIEARKLGNKTIINRQSGDDFFANLPKFGKVA